MPVVGPGSQQAVATDVKPLLEGASEYEYITILNPLTDDFAVRVAQDVPVNMPINIQAKTAMTQTGNDVVRGYGLDLKNPDFQSRKHIFNDTIIKAGQTVNLKGNEAQVAVRQIVNEMMQREGESRKMADPELRREYEEKVIVSRGSIQELMDGTLRTPRNQIDEAINKSNEVNDGQEVEFPGLAERATGAEETPAGSPGTGTNYIPQVKRGPGRPAKA